MLDRDWLKTFAAFGFIPEANRWLPTGACVFVGHEDVVWCVTAAHVLTQAAEKSVGAIVSINGQQTIVDLTAIYKATPGVGWIIDTNSDVAAGPMPMPPGIDIRSIGFDRMLEQDDLLPSMSCLTGGQPYGLPGVDPDKPTPLILDGVIAGVDLARSRVFVSVPTFPGSSGGPIIAYRTPWDPSGSMVVGSPTVFLAGIVTETIVVPNNQPDQPHVPPLHLGCGATTNSVKKLLTSEATMQMLGAIRSQEQRAP